MQRVFIFCFLTICVSAFSQIGSKKHNGVIAGFWINNQTGFKLVLNPEGSGEFNGEGITYVTHGNKLHVTRSAVTTIYDTQLEGNLLTLSAGDLASPVTLTRTHPIATGLTTQEISEQDIPQPLLGIWEGYNETIEFKPDAQCVYRGKPWPYTVADSVITLQTPQGNFIMKYYLSIDTIGADTLHLSFYGADHLYTRHTDEDAAQSEPVHKIDSTLVGNWCYGFVLSGTSQSNSECFQFNADGTYLYITEKAKKSSEAGASKSTDTGQWWSEGTQILLRSSGQGRAAYTIKKMNHPKTGDAMVVLNGKNYISYDKRKPW
jgi:hypothetical protein